MPCPTLPEAGVLRGQERGEGWLPLRLSSIPMLTRLHTHRLSPLFAVAVLLFTPLAFARSRGLATVGCEGCHSGHDNSSLSVSPLVVPPGQTAKFLFTLSDPDAKTAGIFIEIEDTTGFSVTSGSRLAVVTSGITHTSPTEFSGGKVTYEVNWQVPSTQGAIRFVVSALAANGDLKNSGDEGIVEYFDVVYGCSPQTYYRDFDGDGFGREAFHLVHCAGTPPPGYATEPGDCDDNSNTIYPGAEEYCNRKDDNCNGEIDEDALPVELYPDADGDGYYSTEERLSGDRVMGCVPYPGYADQGGDCAPNNPNVNPGAEEICDLFTDENCNGRIDERVRPTCGEGWCRRESRTCDIEDCTPGEPVKETCNFMDDDCNGEIDEGDLCPPGEECLAGECRPAEIGSEPGEEPRSPEAGSGSETGSPPGSSPLKTSSSSCAVTPPQRMPDPRWTGALSLLFIGASGAFWLYRRRR